MGIIKKIVAASLIHTACYALPLGNPQEASLLNCGAFNNYPMACLGCRVDFVTVRVGFYGDYVFNRHLKAKTPSGKWKSLHETRLMTNAAVIAVDILNRGEFFSTLGGTNLSLKSRAVSLGSTSTLDFLLETQTRFSWSVGGNVILWKCGSFSLGIEGQYFNYRPKLKEVRFETMDVLYPSRTVRVKYDEWQLGAGIAYSFFISDSATCVPYIGVEGAAAYGTFGEFLFAETIDSVMLPHFRSDRNVGYALGLSLVGCGTWQITAEARFINETACHVSADFRF